jgi:hypothetical protein
MEEFRMFTSRSAVGSTPEELQKRAATEREHWAKQIKTLGIKVE